VLVVQSGYFTGMTAAALMSAVKRVTAARAEEVIELSLAFYDDPGGQLLSAQDGDPHTDVRSSATSLRAIAGGDELRSADFRKE
jgi:hypothetical protein